MSFQGCVPPVNSAPQSSSRPWRLAEPETDTRGLRDYGLLPYDPAQGDWSFPEGFSDQWKDINRYLSANPDYVYFKDGGFNMPGYRVQLALRASRDRDHSNEPDRKYRPSVIMLVRADGSSRAPLHWLDNQDNLWKASFACMRNYLDMAGGSKFGLQMMYESKEVEEVEMIQGGKFLDIEGSDESQEGDKEAKYGEMIRAEKFLNTGESGESQEGDKEARGREIRTGTFLDLND